MARAIDTNETNELQSDKCEKHDGKILQFLCGDHKEFCCEDCVLLIHNQCEDCVSLSAILNNNAYKNISQETLHGIETLKIDVEKHMISMSASRQRLDLEYELSKKRAEDYRNNIDEELDRLKKQFEEELQDRYKRDIMAIDNDIKTSNDMSYQLFNTMKTVHGAENKYSKGFITILTARKTVEKFQAKLANLSHDTWKKNVLYKINPLLLETLKSMRSFGTFEVVNANKSVETKVTTTEEFVGAVKGVKLVEVASAEDKDIVQIREQKNDKWDKISVIKSTKTAEANKNSSKGDMSCFDVSDKDKCETEKNRNFEWNENVKSRKGNGKEGKATVEHIIYKHAGIIEGMALSENGQLILVDSFNKTLQVSHVKEMKNIQTVHLYNAPRDICIINDEVICISYKESHEIQIAALNGGHLKTLHTIHIGKDCFGISYRNGKIYVTCGHGSASEVRLYLTDQSLKYVRFCCKFPGGKKLVSPCCVYTDRDVSRIYVGDYAEGVIALYRDGKQAWINDGDKILKGVWDMAVDENDDLYVTGHRTNNVVKISSDGSLSGVVVNDLERPTAISYDFMTKTLLIVYDTNQLLLYKVGKEITCT